MQDDNQIGREHIFREQERNSMKQAIKSQQTKLMLSCAGLLIIILLGYIFLDYRITAIISAIGIGLIAIQINSLLSKSEEENKFLEERNDVLSVAAEGEKLFRIIVRNDGYVYYSSKEYKDLFNLYGKDIYRKIDNVFDNLELSPEQRRTILKGIEHKKAAELKTNIKSRNNINVIVKLRPLLRLENYYTLDINTSEILPLDNADSFIESMPIPSAALQADGNIIITNPSFDKYIKSADIKGEIVSNFLSVDSKQKFNDAIFSLSNEKTTSRVRTKVFEFQVKDNPENVAIAHLSKVGTLSRDSRNNLFLLNLIDNSEARKLQDSLNQSQKMQAIGQLAGGIAHDFNNLLTAMLGYTDLLMIRHPQGDESFPDLMQIKQNSNRAANLVRQLLAFSRKQTLKLEKLELDEVVDELSNLLRRLLDDNIRFEIKHQRDLWPVKADLGQLEQVTINLCVNARDAMEGNGTLTIETHNVPKGSAQFDDLDGFFTPENDTLVNDDYVCITISDNGCGMEANILGKIFDPFFSTKEIGAGTGLGLSTVYGIIKQLGGHVFVSSEKDVGTTFKIYLKKYEKSLEETARQKSAAKKAIDPDKSEMLSQEMKIADLSGAGKVLLVEDETHVRNFAARALRNKGYEVLEADCGEDALEIYNEEKDNIKLILTDVMMPGLSGPEFVKKVFDDDPNIKVIFMSGYAEDILMQDYNEDEEFHFLQKPFTLKGLAQKVKEIIES